MTPLSGSMTSPVPVQANPRLLYDAETDQASEGKHRRRAIFLD